MVRLNIFKRTDTIGRDRTGKYIDSQKIGSPAIAKWLKEHPKWLHSLNIFKECKTEADRKRQERDGTGVNVFTPKKCGVGKSIL